MANVAVAAVTGAVGEKKCPYSRLKDCLDRLEVKEARHEYHTRGSCADRWQEKGLLLGAVIPKRGGVPTFYYYRARKILLLEDGLASLSS